MSGITGANISFSYEFEGNTALALDDVTITIQGGELITIIGHNGCGKSTLVKHFNALLPLQRGKLVVAGLDAKGEANIWEIRRRCGMVFQNPDNQFVSSIVEEDIAFGPENYDVPPDVIPDKVESALRTVGMAGFEKKSPHMLSGGQKQRIAIAGVLAVEPDIIIFDEATSMLDPEGRHEVMDIIRSLHEQQRKTIVMITHYIEEAFFSDRVYLMREGKLLAGGTPKHVLTDAALLRSAGLLPPFAVKAYLDLQKAGVQLKECPLTNEELVEELCLLF